MRTLVIHPDFLNIHSHHIDGSLESLQNLVGGWIEGCNIPQLNGHGIQLLVNEEGLLFHLDLNLNLVPFFFVGTAVLVGFDGDEYTSLTDEQMEYAELFLNSLGTPWHNVSIED